MERANGAVVVDSVCSVHGEKRGRGEPWLAQLVEHQANTLEVTGSTPVPTADFGPHHRGAQASTKQPEGRDRVELATEHQPLAQSSFVPWIVEQSARRGLEWSRRLSVAACLDALRSANPVLESGSRRSARNQVDMKRLFASSSSWKLDGGRVVRQWEQGTEARPREWDR
jgi:hypothetical protein